MFNIRFIFAVMSTDILTNDSSFVRISWLKSTTHCVEEPGFTILRESQGADLSGKLLILNLLEIID